MSLLLHVSSTFFSPGSSFLSRHSSKLMGITSANLSTLEKTSSEPVITSLLRLKKKTLAGLAPAPSKLTLHRTAHRPKKKGQHKPGRSRHVRTGTCTDRGNVDSHTSWRSAWHAFRATETEGTWTERYAQKRTETPTDGQSDGCEC